MTSNVHSITLDPWVVGSVVPWFIGSVGRCVVGSLKLHGIGSLGHCAIGVLGLLVPWCRWGPGLLGIVVPYVIGPWVLAYVGPCINVSLYHCESVESFMKRQNQHVKSLRNSKETARHPLKLL